ncbi:DUF397 domain-containing protein [Nonomuraea guangzhouensis]|uniref:DUF397 domain-containing protein n=1 Tax=Nonomuraea guangzhouensis TaxID=1291555 RepID=A0ABW4GD38_9ACTN|nr:DUF397 domain-containing protein [Nonomuraea guangzhouensis]
MTSHPQLEPKWRVSSRCNNGSCVAVAVLPNGRIAVRDTKVAGGDILQFSPEEWASFIGSIKG